MDIKLLSQVLCFIRPNAEFSLDESGLIWLDKKQSEPTQSEIDAGLIAYNAAQVAAEAEAANAKAAAEAKLAALGLTTDDLKALGLGGN
jgi:hypothetical protein